MKIKRRSGSKRKTLHQKNKVFKKIKEHNRKIKKMMKKNPNKRRLRKDPGIPNLWPFKHELLKKIHQKKLEEQQEKEKQRLERLKRRKERKEKGINLSEMAKFQLNAQQKQLEYEAKQSLIGETDFGREKKEEMVSNNSKRKYYGEFKLVVEKSDVIVVVLDARDPLGCRNEPIEKMMESKYPNIKIIYLLNKIDLVPREVLKKWLVYLRTKRPTIAFKSNTQKQKKNLTRNLGNMSAENEKNLKVSGCLGAESLVSLLKNYSRSKDIKRMITVGIIGYPNVGKSSVINSLKRSKVAKVGSKPGVTKDAQEIKLDKNINLLDCPGVVFASEKNLDGSVILRNAIRVEKVEDPILPVSIIVNRCKMESLMNIYHVNRFKDEEDFLKQLARIRGKLKKGGIENLKSAAKIVLRDWNLGRIPFFTLPPSVIEENEEKMDEEKYDDSVVESNIIPSLKQALSCNFVPMVSVSESLEFDKEDIIDDDDEI